MRRSIMPLATATHHDIKFFLFARYRPREANYRYYRALQADRQLGESLMRMMSLITDNGRLNESL